MNYQSDRYYVDGKWMHLPPIDTACGNTASFDDGAGYGFRCDYCGAVVGSIGMPRRCKIQRLEMWKKCWIRIIWFLRWLEAIRSIRRKISVSKKYYL